MISPLLSNIYLNEVDRILERAPRLLCTRRGFADTALLQLALGLTPPWTVSRSDFDPEARRLDIEIDFVPGSRFACPSCGASDCPAYDTERMTCVTSTSSSTRRI